MRARPLGAGAIVMEDAEKCTRLTWRASFAWVVAALWLPHLVALIFDHRARRIAEDFWLWPGMIPGTLFFDDFYTDKFGAFTLLHLVVWTLVARRNKWLGSIGAMLFGIVAAGRLQLLMSA